MASTHLSRNLLRWSKHLTSDFCFTHPGRSTQIHPHCYSRFSHPRCQRVLSCISCAVSILVIIINIGSGGTHDAWVVYPWFCNPDPVFLLFSSKLSALTVLPSTNYFFKDGGKWVGEGGTQTNTTTLIIPFYKYSQSNNCPFQQGFH